MSFQAVRSMDPIRSCVSISSFEPAIGSQEPIGSFVIAGPFIGSTG